MNIRKKRKAQSIPLASMGDIAFLLLIFYMATTMVTDQKPIDIDIPGLNAGTQSSPYPLVIYMDEKLSNLNSVYFYNEIIHINLLGEKIRERAFSAPDKIRVYLNIQKDLPYHFMNDVIIELKKADIRQLIITTKSVNKT